MRLFLVVSTALMVFFARPIAEGAALPYTVTDLGTYSPTPTYFDNVTVSARITTDANGNITSVSNSAGTVNYAFDKSPVEAVFGGYNTPDFPPFRQGYDYTTTYHTKSGEFTTTTTVDTTGNNHYFSTGPFNGKVTDVNIHGQMIGDYTGYLAILANPSAGYGGLVFTYGVAPPNSGFRFSFNSVGALIDDSGRVLAPGSDGHVYLLTPTSLGSPQPVPEPSTLIVFGIMAIAILHKGYRSQIA